MLRANWEPISAERLRSWPTRDWVITNSPTMSTRPSNLCVSTLTVALAPSEPAVVRAGGASGEGVGTGVCSAGTGLAFSAEAAVFDDFFCAPEGDGCSIIAFTRALR